MQPDLLVLYGLNIVGTVYPPVVHMYIYIRLRGRNYGLTARLRVVYFITLSKKTGGPIAYKYVTVKL